jgi:hypothetical protein
MLNIIEIELGNEALDFAIRELGKGNSLARLIALTLRERVTRIWTYLPAFVNRAQVLDFDSGGVCDTDVTPDVSRFAHQILEEGEPGGAWILEDNIGQPSPARAENAIRELTTPFICEKELYQMLKQTQANAFAIQETMRLGGAYPSIGYLAFLRPKLAEKMTNDNVTRSDLEELAQLVRFIVVGAYDEESYVLLQLAPSLHKT